MKKTLALILALVMLFSFAACGGGSDTTTAPAGDESTEAQGSNLEGQLVSVFYYQYADTYMSTVRTALDAELEALGVEYQDFDAAANQTTQNEQIDTAITQGSTCLLVNIVETGSAEVATKIIEKAKAKDIPVVFFNREIDSEVVNSYEKCAYVGTSADEAGILQGEMIGDFLVENFDTVDLNGDGELSYILLKGQEGNPEADNRTKYSVIGANEALEAAGKAPLAFYDDANTDLYLVDKDGAWSSKAGSEYMTTALAEYNKANNNMIEVVIANNDGMAEGAITTLNGAGYNTGEEGATVIPVFGVDAVDSAKELIKAGKMTGTIKQDAVAMAKGIAEIAENAVTGAEVMEGIADAYNVDDDCDKVRIPYGIYTGEE